MPTYSNFTNLRKIDGAMIAEITVERRRFLRPAVRKVETIYRLGATWKSIENGDSIYAADALEEAYGIRQRLTASPQNT